jgi:hypothetical protein
MDAMDPFERSTPERRAAHREQRAADYPLPDARLTPLRESLAQRLSASDITLPPAEFDALVLDMARFALRWSETEMGRRDDEAASGDPGEAIPRDVGQGRGPGPG